MSVAVAIACAICLFGTLSGQVRIVRPVPRPRWRALAAKSGRLTVRAAGEEVLWRWLVLGRMSAPLGLPGALVLSVGGFALAHYGTQGRRGILVHLVTGTTFAALYLATGSLVAPIVAHAAYNVLVSVAVEAEAGGSREEATRS